MALPKNSTPIYNLTIPSTEKVVKFRPFLVKEEKALLLAQQSEDPIVMVNTLQDVINSCVLDKIDITKLAIFDLEYIFTQIRAKSVGEEVVLIFRCQHCDDPKAKTNVTINLTDIEVKYHPEHAIKIPLFDDVGIVMKYPTITIVKKLENIDADNIDDIFDIVINCIDYIYDNDQVYHASESSEKELEEFLNNLNSEQFVKIQSFFETMPTVKQDVKYTCTICNSVNQTTLSGISTFF